jgi:hypothetical protein
MTMWFWMKLSLSSITTRYTGKQFRRVTVTQTKRLSPRLLSRMLDLTHLVDSMADFQGSCTEAIVDLDSGPGRITCHHWIRY